MKINQRMKLIRQTEGFTQLQFAKLIGVASDVGIREIESGKIKNAGSDKIEKLCQKFPEYTLWLMTGQVQPPHQISPEIAKTNATKDKTTTEKFKQKIKTKELGWIVKN